MIAREPSKTMISEKDRSDLVWMGWLWIGGGVFLVLVGFDIAGMVGICGGLAIFLALFLWEKHSSHRFSKTADNESLSTLRDKLKTMPKKTKLIILLSVLGLSLFLYSSRYIYRSNHGNLVRINRYTGTTYIFTGHGWENPENR